VERLARASVVCVHAEMEEAMDAPSLLTVAAGGQDLWRAVSGAGVAEAAQVEGRLGALACDRGTAESRQEACCCGQGACVCRAGL